MHGFFATTDQDWYKYLLSRPDLDEVNFWAPSGRATLGTIPFGAPFFFKLKSPHNAIGGFGFLGPITTIPLSLAWDAFGQKNGAPDSATMLARIRRYRGADLGPDGRPNPDPPVGCRTILQPVFFPPDAWVPAPADWSPNIVQGKTYDLAQGEGLACGMPAAPTPRPWPPPSSATLRSPPPPIPPPPTPAPPTTATAPTNSSAPASARAPSASPSPRPTPALAPPPASTACPSSTPPTSSPTPTAAPTRSPMACSCAPTCTASTTPAT